jgi:rhodanese-related sulfurtransferase
VITRLSRVGYDYAIGFLKGGFEAWKSARRDVDTIASVNVQGFISRYDKDKSLPVIDVRKKSEYDSQHIAQAINAPLDFINDSMMLVDKNKTSYVHCAGGYRSVIFISILQARGYRNLVNVEGGFKSIKESAHFPMTDYVAPVTML